jgi:hypothetical protein
MKQISGIAFFIMFTGSVFCQDVLHDSLTGSGQHLFQPGKSDYGLTLGSSFSSVSGFGSALNTYVTPRFSYNLSKRFAVGGGISIIQSNYFNVKTYSPTEANSNFNGNSTSAVVFVNGQYIVNNRLTLTGSAFKQIPVTQTPLTYNPFNPVSAKGAQGVNFNIGYRVGEHMYIQAGFRYTEGVNPYYTDPFHRNTYMNDSFGEQPGFGIPRW